MRYLSFILALFFIFSCSQEKDASLSIEYEKYTLDNGLEVILHEDKSDPIASVAILYHVGSNREVEGRTGFAHLFEHMLFQESQHVGQDQLFKKIQGAGGTLNGGTWEDGTIYYEVVPKNALEMVLWLESDRMGWLLSTISPEALINQKDVVQNEKRQRVDNNPYGHSEYVLEKLMYPESHPYNWQVIGSLEDIGNATVDDVVDFYKKWYGPNNATLVIAGDFDKMQTKQLVEKYFGEIEKGQEVTPPQTQHVTLDEIKRAYFEDNFAKSPELRMAYPTVEQFTKDAYALDFLADLLADGKKAPLYKVIVEEKKLAPSVRSYSENEEITGKFHFRIRAFPNTKLADVEAAVFEALQRFETEKFTEEDLSRLKAQTETGFYNAISSILGKSFQLAQYNAYAGEPSFITDDIQNILAVTSDDIWRVYNKYIKDKNYVITSFVPKGQAELAAENSGLFPLEEEKIDIAGLKEEQNTVGAVEIEKIPSSFDRSVEPQKGPTPQSNVPEVWSHTFANGLEMYGITHDELPLVQFNLTIKGGLLLDDPDKVGVANLMSDIMMEGTKNKTPIELEEAIDQLGANIRMFTSEESIVLTANLLKKKLDPVYALAEEILLEPRWDEKEFERIKQETIETINRNKANPSRVASSVYSRLVYGDHILANDTYGTTETVQSITIDDLKNFYQNNYSPSVSYVTIAGDISKDEAIKLFSSLEEKWTSKEVTMPDYALPTAGETSGLFFVDVPGAKQSEIRIGYLSMAYDDPQYYPATVMNYKLGGSFNGNLNLILREEKGYTYGARSGFSGSEMPGPFTASSSVRTNATKESVEIFKDEMEKYARGISEEDMQFTKDALIQSNTRRFETLGAVIGMLNNIARYDFPVDYIKQHEQIVQDMTIEQHKQLAQQYLDTGKMIFLVVGDASTQKAGVEKLGLGKATMLDADGNRLN